MIAELGLAALWLSAGLAMLLALAGFTAVARPQARWDEAGAAGLLPVFRALALAQAALCLVAFAALLALFFATDLSVALVAANSHVDKPWLYKLAGTWGNHEGSMLLWVTVLALAGGVIALAEKRLPPRALVATLATQALIAVGFFAFLLLASNPFARLDPAPVAGAGLNPLLQDPGLAFHPPTLYIGYVGLSVAFSFAVAALLTGTVGPAFARAMRPWVLGAWIFLTIGIAAGSYWAYYTLGWGGWWFWDPVENASLMPWLAATALLHSVAVLAKRDALRAWTIMLALIAFAMSMLGTFLVRSGILTSVHAFAVDPERGSFILALFALYVGGAFVLFALRIGAVRQGAGFAVSSREAALVGNNLLLSTILGVVLIGTLYPLVAEAAFGERLSVGPPYFNKTTVPVTFLLVGLLGVGPLLSWRRNADRAALLRLWPAGVAAVAALIAGLALAERSSPLALAGLALGAALVPASLAPLAGRALVRAPLTLWGMTIAHLGVAVAMIGMAGDTLFMQERLAVVRAGDTVAVGPWAVRVGRAMPRAGANFVAVDLPLTARRWRGGGFRLVPASRNFASPDTTTSEAALLTRLDGQLYAVLATPEAGDIAARRWRVRLWWKPLVTLIWAGGGLIALGGALALAGHVARPWRRRARLEQGFSYA